MEFQKRRKWRKTKVAGALTILGVFVYLPIVYAVTIQEDAQVVLSENFEGETKDNLLNYAILSHQDELPQVQEKIVSETLAERGYNALDNVTYEGDQPPAKKFKDIEVISTSYTAYCKGCIGITKGGTDVRYRTPKIIAVDPRLIPLGTLVELFYEGNSMGVYLADDIGKDIKGKRIDILASSYEKAIDWGRKPVTVRILEDRNKE